MGFSFDHDRVARADGAAREHAGKNALAGHNTVTDLLADGAVLVALLADLRHLQQRPADAQAHPDGQRFQLEALDQDVFCERTRRKLRQDGTRRLHAFGGERADLPGPARASPSMPCPARSRTSDTGCFIVPFRLLIQTASTFPDGFTRHPSALQTDLVGLL